MCFINADRAKVAREVGLAQYLLAEDLRNRDLGGNEDKVIFSCNDVLSKMS
jgi:hypothetical protein